MRLYEPFFTEEDDLIELCSLRQAERPMSHKGHYVNRVILGKGTLNFLFSKKKAVVMAHHRCLSWHKWSVFYE